MGCEAAVSDGAGTKTCANPDHKAMERRHREKAEAAFVAKERFKKMQLTQPTDAFTPESNDPAFLLVGESEPVEEHIEWYEMDDEGKISVFNEPELGTVNGGVEDAAASTEPCPSKSAEGNRVFKAQFGRRRTHNEQTLVRPCGIIYARATMFGAEAVSNFLVSRYHLPFLRCIDF